MSKVRVANIAFGVLAGYLTNAAVVGVTEIAYVRWMDAHQYFIVDLVTQVIATIIGGYLCCLIAYGAKRIAATSLMTLGLLIGAASLFTSWKTEPHWYGVALLAVYSPCVWTGYALLLRSTGIINLAHNFLSAGCGVFRKRWCCDALGSRIEAPASDRATAFPDSSKEQP